MPLEEPRIITATSASARIIAGGIVIAFCYWASTVLVTVLVAMLMAYFLDPVVTGLEKLRIPRALGSLLVVLITLALLVVLAWSLVERVDQFGADWPKYRAPLRSAVAAISTRLNNLQAHVSEISPVVPPGQRILEVTESRPVGSALYDQLTSLYPLLFAATFIPFLLFFMLAAKRQVWHATMQLFPAGQRNDVKEALEDVTQVLRSYLAGTTLVGLILVLTGWLFFWEIGLDFPFLSALVSGILNLVPYLGLLLSWAPPFLIGLKKFHTAGPFFGIAAMLTFLHIVAANLLIPALVGWRVRLNALALTISLLFWGWLWGPMGLILAIPITAVIKVVCDHVEGWEAVGHWLSA
jgi:predicted PurR-regulated permease PerM